MVLKSQHDSADPTLGKFSNCLMCLQTIHHDQSEFKAHSLEKLSDQFEVLCEYMRWSPPLKYQFDFNNDTFPFCKECQKTLDTSHKSHQLLHELQKLIGKTVSTLSGKILLSQGDKTDIHGNKSGSSETTGSLPEESLFKRNDKINYYRDLTLRTIVSPTEVANDPIEPLDFEPLDVANETSDIETEDAEGPDAVTPGASLCNQDTEDYKINEKVENASPILSCTKDPELLFLNSPRIIPKTRSVTETQDEVKSLPRQLSHESVPSEEGQREDSDYEPSIASLQNDLSDSDEVKFGEDTKATTEVQEGVKVPPEFTAGKGKFFDRVRTVGKCKYIFDEKYSFEYNSNVEWVCCSCRRQFTRKRTVLNHLDKTCGARKLFKLIPPDKFVWTDLFDNSKTYSFERVNNTYKCNHCSCLLTSLKRMKQHVRHVHIHEGSTTCKICGKICTTKYVLKNHIETHRNVEPPEFTAGKGKFYDRVRTVGKCKYIFDEKYAFEYNSNGKWVCCSCRFQYLQKNTLLDHLAKTCKGAQKLFKLIPPDKFVWTDLLDNSKTYSFERVDSIYKCNHCSYSGSYLRFMKQHVRYVHVDVGGTTCKICGKVCNTKTLLKNHLETHTYVPQFICELCGASFRFAKRLASHKAVQHLEIFEKKNECEKCKRVYGTEKRLRQHKNQHKNYVCHICGKNISGVPSRMKTHMLSHGKENTFECKKCGKKFRYDAGLRIHLRSHDGAKPFSCDICGMKFTQSYSVTRHKNVVHNSNKATKKNTKSRAMKQQEDSSEEDYEESSDGDQNDDDKN